MIRKDKHKFANGTFKTQIRVTEGYRDSKTGKVKQKTIKDFGYLEDNADQEAFMKKVKEFDEQFKKDKRVVVNETSNQPFYEDESSETYNFGYRFLETIYDNLKLDEVFNSIDYRGTHKLNDMFKFLVLERIMNPNSKRATYQTIDNFYDKKYDFSLYELYRSLDFYSASLNGVQKHLNDRIKDLIGRNKTEVFYDTTNYYFQKDYEDEDEYVEVNPIITSKNEIKKLGLLNIKDDSGNIHQLKKVSGLLKRGVSKEHVVDPIVQLGLLMDSNGIPINMQIFPGNTADSKTMIPTLDDVKKKYELNRVVVVADKGMNCNENIDIICNNGDGYMFSQILKGKKGNRYHDKMFDESLYTVVNKDYKYQIFEEDYNGLDKDGKKVTRRRKVLIYWNGAAARRDQKRREEKIAKAKKALTNNAYTLNHGFVKYIKKENIVSSTGEIADSQLVRINDAKIEKDALYDGYFAIVTSELQYDENKIREVYHGLWRIEESFRITKSDLAARPIFVRTKEHIEGHFLICFVALIIIRTLQHKMNHSLSVERIVRALHMCSCTEMSKGTIHVILKDTYKKFELKKDKDGIEYYTLNLLDTVKETVEDYKEILKYYDANLCVSLMNKSQFDKYIRSIKLKNSF